jgi:D-glycero-alpha-D-manno-heptose-7-phosphate kinase
MIISKTPYRISFFGGGSDYPEWYLKNGGSVISSTINKFIYISCRELPPYFKYKHRFVYSEIEMVKNLNEIKHTVIRSVLNKFKNEVFFKKAGLEIHYDGDFPSRTGIGSSSAFTVGFLNLINNFFKKKISKRKLASESIYLEQNVLKETVGSQDQISTSYGGFNEINFFKNGNYEVIPLITNKSDLINLENQMILVFSGVRNRNKTANNIASSYVSTFTNNNKKHIYEIIKHAQMAKKLIKNKKFDDFGILLNETWKAKRELSKLISSDKIDYIYELGITNGALGGKLLGAGGAGFFLFYLPKNKREVFLNSFKKVTCIPFKFEQQGSRIVFNDERN